MTSRNYSDAHYGLFVSYHRLGTITVDEFRQALLADLHVLEDVYNVRYLRSGRLRFTVTDEFGQECRVRRPGGGTLRAMDTHHHRPVCKDYEL